MYFKNVFPEGHLHSIAFNDCLGDIYIYIYIYIYYSVKDTW